MQTHRAVVVSNIVTGRDPANDHKALEGPESKQWWDGLLNEDDGLFKINTWAITKAKDGDVIFFAAGSFPHDIEPLGHVRNAVAAQLKLIDESIWSYVWITDFPMFEHDERENRWTALFLFVGAMYLLTALFWGFVNCTRSMVEE